MKIKNLITKKQQPQPNENDNLIWQEVIKDVKKIKKTAIDLSKPKPKDFVIKENVNVFEVYTGSNLEYICHGDASNIDNATLRRFKRGEIAIEAILDLHGYTTSEAFDKVETFIKKAYLQKKRCVQIVTGKGLHQEDDVFAMRGVLRNVVPQWLNTDKIRPFVLLFDYSRPEDGGEGALTILLRRKR